MMNEARDIYLKALDLDPENVSTHWGLYQVFRNLDEQESAAKHLKLHGKYKTDDNAKDEAFAKARKKYPAANKAAEAVVIYELNHRQWSKDGESPGDRPTE
jgi:hypothetical protein